MSLEKTIQELRDLLNRCTHDLQKTERGNKAAAQRVRTGTVRLEKVAKRFRKESVTEEKTGNFKKYKDAIKRNAKKKNASKKEASNAKSSKAKKNVKSSKPAAKKAAPKKQASHSKKSAPKKKITKAPQKKIALKRPANKQNQRRLGW